MLNTTINAPVVVAQWISAQYYFSSVDPDRYGAGDKSTHNVVGDVGVVTGAFGDLRTGLPWQTLFAAEAQIGKSTGRHEPLRLSVILYSGTRDISTVLDASPHVSALVSNGWIHMIAIDPATGALLRITIALAANSGMRYYLDGDQSISGSIHREGLAPATRQTVESTIAARCTSKVDPTECRR